MITHNQLFKNVGMLQKYNIIEYTRYSSISMALNLHNFYLYQTFYLFNFFSFLFHSLIKKKHQFK